MAPAATETTQVPVDEIQVKKADVAQKAVPEETIKFNEQAEELPELRTGHHEPLKLSGALDQYDHFEVTPTIGREYSNVKLYDLLRAPNSDELIRDLAITSMCLLTLNDLNVD